MKSKVFFIFIILFTLVTINVSSKNTLDDKYREGGHANDISRLLTGNPISFYSNSNFRVTLEGFSYLMYLVVDSTMKMANEDEANEVRTSIEYLRRNMNKLNFNTILNFREFLTPGGNTHGHYTHLGWDHIYPDDDYLDIGGSLKLVNTNKRWQIRKKILTDAMGKTFDFSILNFAQKNSLAALFYYVHILGDHEHNEVSNAFTRIPLQSKNEQNIEWETSNKKWVPEGNIVAELKKHLMILFQDQRSKPSGFYYQNLMRELDSIPHFDNHKLKARHILFVLYRNVPSLMQESSFGKKFYKKHQIRVNTNIPYLIIMPERYNSFNDYSLLITIPEENNSP